MKITSTVLFLFLLVLFCFCKSQPALQGATAQFDAKESSAPQPSVPKEEMALERKIIKEGEIDFQTSDINETKSTINRVVSELDGYISKEEAADYSGRLEHHLTIRIPATKFDSLLIRISSNIIKLDRKSINVLDVTAEFIDVEARVKTKKELQNRYKEILQKANKVEEILAVEKEMSLLGTVIESLEGQMKYMKDRIAYSTLNVTYYEKRIIMNGISARFIEAIQSGWTYFLLFLVSIVNLWTFILLAAIVFYIVKWRSKKNKSNIK